EDEGRPERELPKPSADPLGNAGLPVVWLARSDARPLLTGSHQVRVQATVEPARSQTANVVGRLRAGGAVKQPGGVIAGAPVGPLGLGGPASLAPGVTEPHNGADDNASGVAAVLEVARTLAQRKAELDRDIIIVGFSGEELGDLGSSAFAKSPPGGLKVAD